MKSTYLDRETLCSVLEDVDILIEAKAPLLTLRDALETILKGGLADETP